MTDGDDDLNAAYALKTPEDSKRLYGAWAESYDTGFADELAYRLPEHVAEALAARSPNGPILDIGAGTGLVGLALSALGLGPVDGTDISQEMLDKAAQKDVYQRLFTGDMTKRLPVNDGAYNAVVSSGTFTTGHVGPEALDEVLRIAATGALIAISISEAHWEAAGFRSKFDSLVGKIHDFELVPVQIYGAEAKHEHADDRGNIALFYKA
ncbi:methyltransferase domain-containing protein [Lentibacter algarum]|uniref:class I SAM-dependent DNA methyltransferase n=1 Tax=Lentibacter algarum TaxID=576131 RepID=UPI001C07CCD2|nr:methyltransferase domain-containing protein [Lentibacter algarum]MBU2981731.1 methyltransferase domain-containing protein [Lentibacter algarum]